MILFSNAKINIGLHILRKREDGYHDIESFFMPIPYSDIIEIQTKQAASSGITFTQSGIRIPGNEDDNLCLKACRIYLKETKWEPDIRIHLHKQIPTGAGLGGGSSNAAFILKGLNSLYAKPKSDEELMAMAEALGSDCPFFIRNKPAIVSGRGEIMIPFPRELKGYYLVVIHPGIHISTPDAYASIQPKERHQSIDEICNLPVESWKDHLKNDFESYVFSVYPRLGEMKASFYETGALYASMTGSGSALYGIFSESPQLSDTFRKTVTWEGIL